MKLTPRSQAGEGVKPGAIVAFLVLLNLVAIYGQAAWFRAEITNHNGPEDWIIPVGLALVIEGVGVYLAAMAHASLMADQSAGLLRFGSYLVGVLVGFLNYWHFAGSPSSEWTPTPAAVTFGALSAISPWLWAIYSRYRNRDRLDALGLVDVRGVKLSTARKFWHPIKSLRVMSHASWEGITDPQQAVASWEGSRSTGFDQRVTSAVLDRALVDQVAAPVSPGQPALEPLSLTTDELWALYGQPSAEVPDRALDQGPAADQPLDQTDDQVDQGPERPVEDDALVEEFGERLRELRAAGRLNRNQVEKLCKVHKNQALRLVDRIKNETTSLTTSSDQEET